MIVCRICANANGITERPVTGSYECGVCGGAGQNAAFEVDTFTPEQAAKAEVARQSFSERMLEKVAELARRGLKEEKPS